jgi:hypothetical protein
MHISLSSLAWKALEYGGSVAGLAILLVVYRKLNHLPVDPDDIRTLLKIGSVWVGIELIGFALWHLW